MYPIRNQLQVLIAEPQAAMADALTALVEGVGNAEVMGCARTEQEALVAGLKAVPDVALIDLSLSPNCSLISGIHSASPETRIIVLADRQSDSPSSMVKALASGAVGAIYKESMSTELAKALTFSSERTPVVAEEAAGLLLESYLGALTDKHARDVATIEALAAAVEVRDLGTGRHLHRVTELARLCMEQVDPQFAKNEEVAYGFMLHDVGKIGVPDTVLNKPGALDDQEWAIMRRHPEMGVKIVRPIGFSSDATDVILCHHERWDGRGYPNGLSKDEIPLTARAFAVADAYDAITSDRPYRYAMSHDRAVSVIQEEAGRSYDPEIVDVFVDLIEP